MPKKMMKDAMSIAGAGIGLGIGASAIREAGGDASAMTSMSGKLPMMGSLAATGAVFRGLGRLQKASKMKK